MNRLAGYLIAAGALFLMCSNLLAADNPLVGTWRLIGTLPSQQGGNDTILALVEISGDAATPKVELLTHGLEPFKGSKISKVAVKDGEISFVMGNENITLPFQIVVPSAPAKLAAGHLVLRGNLFPAQLAKTEQKDLKGVKLEATTEGADRLKAISEAESVDEKAKLAEALIKDLPGRAITIRAATMAVLAGLRSGKPEKASATADLVVKASKQFGRDFSVRVRSEVAGELAKDNGSTAKALEIAEAALKDLGPNPSPRLESLLLGVQKTALEKSGKKEELAKVATKLDALEGRLDEEFEKDNITFEAKPYGGRKDEFNRVAVVELFTGAQCPPCVAADIAFDGLVKTYKPKDVILLQYHLHIPGPDALTNPSSEGRQQFYEKDIEGTPTALINGKVTKSPLGGGKPNSGSSYSKVTKEIDDFLAKATTPIKLKVDAGTSGTKVGAEVTWSGIEKKDNLKLKAVLVEDVVRYPGGNGQRLHHHIVREFLGGVDGIAIKDAEGKETITADLNKVRENLKTYLEKFEKENGAFPVAVKPVDLKKLKIVVFIQNEKTHEILQAAQADLDSKN